MFTLYFGNMFAAITTALVVGLIAFIAVSAAHRDTIQKWGRRIAIFIVLGTAVSATSAMRDGYAGPGALFAMDSMQSTICSLAGGTIFLTGLVSIFLRKQQHKKICFFIISALFLVQVAVIEISRIALTAGGVK